jgi:hypothetical protein
LSGKVLTLLLPRLKIRLASVLRPVWIKIQRTPAKSRRFTAAILSSARE